MVSKKPTQESLPPLFVDREDREAFARQRQSTPTTGGQSQQVTNTQTNNSKASSSAGGRGIAWFALLVALSGYGGSWFLHEQLSMRTASLKSATLRIDELERQLSLTGEELGESSGSLQTQLVQLNNKTQTLWDEMDKLWASAWRKNQAQIKTVENKTAANSKQASSNSKANDTTKKNLWKVSHKVDGNADKIVTVETALAQSAERITATSDMMIAIEDTVQQMEESNVMAKSDNLKRDTSISALTQQIRDMQGVNQRLQKQLTELNDWRKNQSTSNPPVTNANQ